MDPDTENHLSDKDIECHYLNAITHEGLVSLLMTGGALTRVVPKEGKVILGMNINSLHNLPSLWKNTNALILEDGYKIGNLKLILISSSFNEI
ncbi:hypothetical protein K502DRAFT_353109 [Neoconidiobolus thromboides FSU 785]|nr:hypothetical protein K502DRAFT_353109 [Neoconidiobolus thromboides FSU 785]